MNIYHIGQKEKPNWFGIGQTEGPLMIEQYGIPRRGADYNKARDAGVVYTEVSFWENVGVSDKKIHKFIVNIPGIRQVGTEAFEIIGFGLTHEKIAYIIEQEFFSKIPKTRKDLNLRKHQKEFVDKVISSWEYWKEFLLFAKCRAGKSIMTLSAIVKSGIKMTLIVSRYNSPIQSWVDDSAHYAPFQNIVFINLKDKDFLSQIEYWYNTDKQIILWSTIQGKNRWNNIPYDVNLIVYDEAHDGYGTSQWKKLCERFPSSKRLYVTGTAFSLVWDFSTSNRFIYSYFEEQRDKKLGLNNAPTMRVTLAKFATEEYRRLYGDDPDAMKNLFCMNEDKTDFKEPSLVQDFYMKYFSEQKHLRPKDRLLNGKFHIFMTLPSVAACHASVKYLEKTKYVPLVVTGDTNENSDTIKKHVAENEYTIILTVSANVLGVTIPEIDTIINASEGESINFWTQFAFRGGSSNRDWDVIDFCPQRCLNSLREAFLAACDNDPTISKYTLLDFVPISEWVDGFETLSQNDIFVILATEVTNTISMVSGVMTGMNLENLANCKFNLTLSSKEKSKMGDKRVVNDNGSEGKGNLQRENNSPEKEINLDLVSKKQTIRAILERVPLTIYHCIKSGNIPNSVHTLVNSDHYMHNTLDTERILEQLVFDEVINAKSFSYRIDQAVIDIQYSMSEDECKTLEKLSCSRQSQQSMPIELIDDLLGDFF